MKILVFGAGYVGLTTAVVMASKNRVTLLETDAKKRDMIESGVPPFFEKEIGDSLRFVVSNGNLVTIDPERTLTTHDFVIICVGTPSKKDGSVDLIQLDSAVSHIDSQFDNLLSGHLVIVNRSTVPPGTTRINILRKLAEHHSTADFGVVFNPEFLRQGSAINDLSNPDRIIIGGSDSSTIEKYQSLCSTFLTCPTTPIVKMSLESAELSKYASNCFLATKISFANEISSIAEKLENIDIDIVMDSVAMDHRICPSHLKAGLGFGGSCLPKDLSSLISLGNHLNLSMNLLRAVDDINNQTVYKLLNLIQDLDSEIKSNKVAVLGLTFKKGTDDTRSSFSIDLINHLVKMGAFVFAHDPVANNETLDESTRNSFTRCSSISDCTDDALAVFLMTDWDIYEQTGLDLLTKNMRHRVFVDARRLFANSEIPSEIDYRCLGSIYFDRKVESTSNHSTTSFENKK